MKTKFFNRLIVMGLALMMTGNVWGANVTTGFDAAPAGTYIKVTDASTLSVNDVVIIVASSANYAMSTAQNTNNRGQIGVTKSGTGSNTIVISGVSTVQKVILKAAPGGTSNAFGLYVGNSAYLAAASSSSNYLRSVDNPNTNSDFTIAISSGNATLTAKGTYTRNVIKYNSGSSIFSGYASGQGEVCLYKLQASSTTWKLMGLGDWSTGLTFDSNGECTKDLAENTTYKDGNGFKICKDGSSWYGNNGTMNDGNCTGWEFTSSGGNCAITSGAAGTYTFKMTVNGSGNPVLTVTYPAPVWRLAGFNDWSHPIEFVNGTCTKTLEAKTYNQNTDAGFKVVKNSAAYYGANSTMTRSNASGIEWTFNGDQNCGITADVAGTYTFTINTSGSTPKVTVTYPKVLSSISVKTAPTKTSYIEGQYFDPTGLVITKTYSDASTEDVSYASSASAFTFSPTTSTALQTTNNKVTITVGGKSVDQTIEVNAKALSSISVKTAPTKVDYEVNENFNPAGLVIKLTYNDASTEDVAYSGHESSFSFNPSTSTALQTSHTKVAITYGGKSVDQTITVKQYWTVSFVNSSQSIAGTEFAERKIEHNGEVGTLPTLKSSDACDATSRVFMGWTTQTISSKTSTAPTFVTATTKVTQNMVLRAVWARQQ